MLTIAKKTKLINDDLEQSRNLLNKSYDILPKSDKPVVRSVNTGEKTKPSMKTQFMDYMKKTKKSIKKHLKKPRF